MVGSSAAVRTVVSAGFFLILSVFGLHAADTWHVAEAPLRYKLDLGRKPTHASAGYFVAAGATVVLEVASIDRSDPIEASRISFRVRSVDVNGEPQPVAGDVAVLASMDKVQSSSGNDRTKVIGGAVAGAILGRILGKSTKATVIGAAAGAAAGTVAARNSQSSEACLPQGSPLRLTITRDIVVRSAI